LSRLSVVPLSTRNTPAVHTICPAGTGTSGVDSAGDLYGHGHTSWLYFLFFLELLVWLLFLEYRVSSQKSGEIWELEIASSQLQLYYRLLNELN
jgi:hypothetical protein